MKLHNLIAKLNKLYKQTMIMANEDKQQVQSYGAKSHKSMFVE